MKKVSRLLAYSLTLIIASSVCSYGWNSRGHMMVAAVAYDKLTANTKKRVAVLIRRNPDFRLFLKQVPRGTSEAKKQKMLFMVAATWPDMIKSDGRYHNDGTDPSGNVPPPTGGDRNTGYDDFARHKYWHFVDISFPDDIGLPTPNAQDRIDAFVAVLSRPKSPDTDDLKSYDLCWLLHLVGDVHQPLHCITRTTPDSTGKPKGDAGGNAVRLSGSDNNLHSAWDDAVGKISDPQSVITGQAGLPAAPATEINDLDVGHWVAKSADLAKTQAYKDPPIGKTNGPFTLTAPYRTNMTKIAKARIAVGGARLAKILNEKLQ
jgi:hypothetical protein